jgi:hypothetical protein
VTAARRRFPGRIPTPIASRRRPGHGFTDINRGSKRKFRMEPAAPACGKAAQDFSRYISGLRTAFEL